MRTRKGTNEGILSDAVVRSRVVLEILSTERDYVKNLEDVVEVSWDYCFDGIYVNRPALRADRVRKSD